MMIQVNVSGLDKCDSCLMRSLIRRGMNAMHRVGVLTASSATDYVSKACHGCLAEGAVESDMSGRWSVLLLAYDDDPDGEPMPADGGPR